MSTTQIPRPLYHYSLPFYMLLSLVLYLLATRLVQPTRRWRISRKTLLVSLAGLFILVGIVATAFLLTAHRYKWVRSGQTEKNGLTTADGACAGFSNG